MIPLTAEEMFWFNAVIWLSVLADIALNLYQTHRQEQLEQKIHDIEENVGWVVDVNGDGIHYFRVGDEEKH